MNSGVKRVAEQKKRYSKHVSVPDVKSDTIIEFCEGLDYFGLLRKTPDLPKTLSLILTDQFAVSVEWHACRIFIDFLLLLARSC